MEAFEFLRNRQLLSPDQSLHETAMPNYTWGDLIQLLDDYLKANSSQLEPLVSGKFAEEDIKKRYNTICKQIELWQKRIEKEWSYEDGYKNGLVYAEKQFRNLFS